MKIQDNPERFWFAIFGASRFECGWVFGKSAEEARDKALAECRRAHVRGKGLLSLQQDVTPAQYFAFEVSP